MKAVWNRFRNSPGVNRVLWNTGNETEVGKDETMTMHHTTPLFTSKTTNMARTTKKT